MKKLGISSVVLLIAGMLSLGIGFASDSNSAVFAVIGLALSVVGIILMIIYFVKNRRNGRAKAPAFINAGGLGGGGQNEKPGTEGVEIHKNPDGSYGELIFTNEKGEVCSRDKATMCNIHEYDASGNLVRTIYGTFGNGRKDSAREKRTRNEHYKQMFEELKNSLDDDIENNKYKILNKMAWSADQPDSEQFRSDCALLLLKYMSEAEAVKYIKDFLDGKIKNPEEKPEADEEYEYKIVISFPTDIKPQPGQRPLELYFPVSDISKTTYLSPFRIGYGEGNNIDCCIPKMPETLAVISAKGPGWTIESFDDEGGMLKINGVPLSAGQKADLNNCDEILLAESIKLVYKGFSTDGVLYAKGRAPKAKAENRDVHDEYLRTYLSCRSAPLGGDLNDRAEWLMGKIKYFSENNISLNELKALGFKLLQFMPDYVCEHSDQFIELMGRDLGLIATAENYHTEHNNGDAAVKLRKLRENYS